MSSTVETSLAEEEGQQQPSSFHVDDDDGTPYDDGIVFPINRSPPINGRQLQIDVAVIIDQNQRLQTENERWVGEWVGADG